MFLEIVLTISGIVFGSVATYLYTRWLHGKDQLRWIEASQSALNASQELVTSLESQMSVMSNQCADLGEQLAQARADAKYQKGLADLHISKNVQFDEQAQAAWQQLREYGLRAGNAQAWLFRELEQAVRLINRFKVEKGEKPLEVNPQLVSMLSDIKRDFEQV